MKVATIIQARTGSRRLPGKVLLPVGGRPILEWVVHRVRQATHAGEIVVATSTLTRDDPVVDLCERIGVAFLRGSETDVLDRYYEAAVALEAEIVVRVTADSPLLAPELLDLVVLKHVEKDADYVCIVDAAVGLTAEALSRHALTEAWRRASAPADREHVTTYVVERPEEFKVVLVPAPAVVARSAVHLTLDYDDDLALLRALYERSSHTLFDRSGGEIIDMVSADTELLAWAEQPT